MKKTQIIEALRNIKKQKVSYISIMLIAFLGVTCFTGVRFASKGLSECASDYYDKQNYRDFEIVSAVMFTDDDLAAISSVDGVKDAEGMLRTTGKVIKGESKAEITVQSLTERVNRPELLEGVLPKNAGECVIERGIADNLSINIGDTMEIEDTGSDMKMLTRKDFTVVGIVIHPDHLLRSNAFGSYVILTKDDFDNELLGGRSIYAEIVIDKPVGIDRYEDDYNKLTSEVYKKLEHLSAERSSKTLMQIWEQLEGYKTRFRDDVFKPLLINIVKSAKDMSDDEAKAWIEKYDWVKENPIPDLSDADLDAALIPILKDFGFTLPQKDELIRSFVDQIKKAADRFKDAGLTDPDIMDSDDIIDELQQFIKEQDLSVYDKLMSAVKLWNRGHERYLATIEKLKSSNASLHDFNGVWLIFDAQMNAGYMHMSMSVSGISAISVRFTLLFIIVGAIVIYSTIGKLVDEQKKLVGASKAFGFYNREIFGKYLIFGGSATLLGAILGELTGYLFLQYFVEFAYGRYYVLGTPSLTVIPWMLILIPAAALLLAFAAVWFASAKLLRSTAISLMQDNVSLAKRKAKKVKKSKLSLYQRLILRNMRTDFKRVLVTVVSIAGSCALILIGFSIYLSVRKTVRVQFEDIVKYDSVVYIDSANYPEAAAGASSVIEKEGASAIPVLIKSGAFRSGDGTEPAEFVVSDISKLNGFLELRDPRDGSYLNIDDGVFLPSSYANNYGLKAGDECILVDGSGTAHSAKVGGVFENYLGRTVVLGPNGYEDVFGKEYAPNALLTKYNGADRKNIAEKLKNVPGYEKIARSDDLRVVFNNYSDLLAVMMVIIITAAGLMSAVILTNLVNICILQKKRELTVMRVNGFTTKEVKNYITREAFLTSTLGIILGVAAGYLQFRTIMPSLGKSYTVFIMTPDILAILLSSAITLFFTVIIYRFALRKVKDLKLTDIA